MKERWWTAPAAGDGGGDVIVTGRDYMDDIIAKGKLDRKSTRLNSSHMA